MYIISLPALIELINALQSTNITVLELGHITSLTQNTPLAELMLYDTLYDTLQQLLIPNIAMCTQDNIYTKRHFTKLDLSQWPDYDNRLIDILCTHINHKLNTLQSLILINNNISIAQLNKLFDCIEHSEVQQLIHVNISHNILTHTNKHALCDMIYKYYKLQKLVSRGCMNDSFNMLYKMN